MVPAMGLIEFGHRISRHAWRLPLLGQVLAADDAALAAGDRHRNVTMTVTT